MTPEQWFAVIYIGICIAVAYPVPYALGSQAGFQCGVEVGKSEERHKATQLARERCIAGATRVAQKMGGPYRAFSDCVIEYFRCETVRAEIEEQL